MSQDDKLCTGTFKHTRGDLTGEGSLISFMHVLSADHDFLRSHHRQGRKRRGNENLDSRRQLTLQMSKKFLSLCPGLVHLPVGSDDGGSFQHIGILQNLPL